MPSGVSGKKNKYLFEMHQGHFVILGLEESDLEIVVLSELWYIVDMSNLETKRKILWSHPLVYKKGRLSVWQKAFGILKNNKLNHIKELKKIRTEWNRKLPS